MPFALFWAMGKSCPLSALERQKLEQWSAAHGTPQQVALRCRIILAAAAGESNVAIAERLAVNRNTVILWRKRFGEEGLDGLWDIAPGRGRKPLYQMQKIAAIVDFGTYVRWPKTTKISGLRHRRPSTSGYRLIGQRAASAPSGMIGTLLAGPGHASG